MEVGAITHAQQQQEIQSCDLATLASLRVHLGRALARHTGVPLKIVERLQLLVVSCEGLRVGLSDGGNGAQLEDCPGKGDKLGRCGGGRNQGILKEKGALGFAEEVVGGIQLLVLEGVLELRDDGLEVGHIGEM